MRNRLKRIISALLVAIMLVGIAPLSEIAKLDFSSPLEVNASAANEYKYTLVWPVKSNIYMINSAYIFRKDVDEKFHTGIDLRCSEGTEVCATDDGEVVKIYECSNCNINTANCKICGGYGYGVLIYHNNLKISSAYAHMKAGSIRVNVGEKVKKGQTIGLSGNTGASGGPHLHFELMRGKATSIVTNRGIRKELHFAYWSDDSKKSPDNSRINPMPYLNLNSNPNHPDAFMDYGDIPEYQKNPKTNPYLCGDVRYVKAEKSNDPPPPREKNEGTKINSDDLNEPKTPPAPNYVAGVYKVTATALNIRSGAGTSNPTVASTIPQGTELEIVETSKNGWGKTNYRGTVGWVSLSWCQYLREIEKYKKPAAPSATLSSDSDVPTGAIVNVTWNSVEHAETYTAYLKNSSGAVVKTVSSIGGNSISFVLKNAGTYYATVRAVNAKYTSAESSATKSVKAHAPATVRFVDWDGTVQTRKVEYGKGAIPPDPPSREGHTFMGWDKSFDKVYGDLTVKATYKINTYTVRFLDMDGNDLGAPQKVNYGSSAVEPSDKNVQVGREFIGWSSEDWRNVKKNLTVKGSYKWRNEDLPFAVSDASADYINGGYQVRCKLYSHDQKEVGRVVIALKTAEGKLVTTTESGAISLGSGTREKVYEDFIPTETPASVAEIYVVSSFQNSVPVSESVSCQVNNHTEWSEWQTNKPANHLYDQLETKTQFRTRKKEYAEFKKKNMSGWNLYDTKVSTSHGTSYSYIANVQSDEHVRTVKTSNEDITETWYRYKHYTNGGLNNGKYATWACAENRGNTVDGCGPTNIGPHYYESKTPLPCVGNSKTGPGLEYGEAICPAWVSERGKTCLNTWWFEEEQIQKKVGTRTKYSYTDYYYTYKYWRWGNWSGWSDAAATGNSEKEVSTRPLYRYKKNDIPAAENTSGMMRTVSGFVDKKFAGEQATVFIYKISEASDWTGEFVGQTVIANDGSYSFSFKLREEPTEETGDFTVSLGIEGCSEAMIIDTIKAPKHRYNVKFVDYDGTIWNEQTVIEGESAIVPENPEREGYIFVGWDASLSNIGGDMELTARYIQKEYTVVFVDWSNKVVQTKNFMHGDPIEPPEVNHIDGYDFMGWSDVILGETKVTSNMVITAEFKKKTFVVEFYDFDGNIISNQSVKYGERPVTVAAPEKDNCIFLGWKDVDNDIDNETGVVKMYPTFVFDETVENPVASLVEGTYETVQTVELTSPTETAVIYYTLDGSDPHINGIEYTEPITLRFSTELKFYAEAFEMNASEVITNHYAINAGNTVSDWMLESDIPEYVFADRENYVIESAQGYSYKDVITTSDLSLILSLENTGWTNEDFTYGEWNSWMLTEPNVDGIACEVESKQPTPETENRYVYTRYKYVDSASGGYRYSLIEPTGVESELEKYYSETKIPVAGFLAGTETKYYLIDGEQWLGQGTELVEVVPDYMMYRYRTKNYTLSKWTDWSIDAPAENETRENRTNTVYRYTIPEMYIVKIINDNTDFNKENETMLGTLNEPIVINAEEYEHEGYDFLGFYTDSEFTNYWNYQTQTVFSDLTLYPKYRIHTHSVTFVDYDSAVIAEEIVDYGSYANEPEAPLRFGYVFVGWDTEDYFEVKKNMVVTAQYVLEEEYCTVTLDHSQYYLMTGSSFTLNAIINPADAPNQNLEWYSEDTSVAVVNDAGFVTAVGQGVTKIVVASEATGETDECIITVSANPANDICLVSNSSLRIDAENSLLRNIDRSASTVADIRKELVNTSVTFIDINGNELGEDDIVGTGTVIRYINGGKTVDELTVVVVGDMNGDGRVNNRDASMITRYLVEKETADFCQMVAIDVNGDGYINNRDASMISRYLVGKEVL